MAHKEDMVYNGTKVDWHGVGVFKATSGLMGHQNSDEQGKVDMGPIPEGRYSFSLHVEAKQGEMISETSLDVREGIESLPATWTFHGKIFFNNAWGPDRVRLRTEHIDNPANRKRGGFYLHDSTKGFSHGCIEVDPAFFLSLRRLAATPPAKRGNRNRLILKVKYPGPGTSTNGGTLVSP